MFRRLIAIVCLSLIASPVLPATQGGPIPVPLPLFPGNNWWNTDISNAPTVGDSTVYYSFMGGSSLGMHPDFGGDAGDGEIYGIPFILVDGSQAKKIVDFVEFDDQSDGVGQAFYPIPDEAITQGGWIEGGPPGNEDPGGDRHMLIVDTTNNHLYELYHSYYNGTNWEAGSGAFFDMNTNNRRPETWTSADASGMAILPGLVRYDEVYGPDEIRHAFRVTFGSTNGYVFPASHTAGSTSGALPMGARIRLKASKNISSFSPEMQKIFRAFKKYGLIVADNGTSMYVSGAYDTRWDNDILNPVFAQLKVSDFEVIQLGWKPDFTFVLTLPSNAGKGDVLNGTLTVYDANYNVATGYTGTVHFTSTDGLATLPSDYTFLPADAGTHTFSSGFTFQTSGSQVVTFTDTVTATRTGSRGITIGPATPAGFSATATSATQVAMSWSASSGATQYEVRRGNTLLTTTGLTSFTDPTASAGTSYVYKVRALDASLRPSSDAMDVATTVIFTDDPLAALSTVVKAVHVTQLRTAVNAMRAAAGLGAATFTDPSPTTIKKVHVQELRDALVAARSTLGFPTAAFIDSTLTVGSTKVKAAHVSELRAGVK